ncbi:MAG: ABC transporter permease [Vulcanisaeta sp.]
MRLYLRALPTILLAMVVTSAALGIVVMTALSLYNMPRLFLPSIGNVTIKKSSSISVFTSWTPEEITYSLRAMGIPAVPEVLVPGVANNTPILIRGVVPSYLGYYGIDEPASLLNCGALVGSGLAKVLGLGVGDTLMLTSFKGISVNVTVCGVYSSSRFPQLNYNLIVNESLAKRLDGLPQTIVSVIYANVSLSTVKLINEVFGLRVITTMKNAYLAILNSMNGTVLSTALSNETLMLPFGAYYLAVYNSSSIIWYGEVLLVRNTTVVIAKPIVTNITMTRPAYPTLWVSVEWPNGTLVSSYYLLIYYSNDSLAYAVAGHGVTPVALPQGTYRLSIIVGNTVYSVVKDLMPGVNASITIMPYSIVLSELASYAPNYVFRVAPVSPSLGPQALLSTLRVGLGTLVGIVVGLLIILSLGVVGIVGYSYRANEELINYLILQGVRSWGLVVMVDLPLTLVYAVSSAIGVGMAYFAWPLIMNALGISVLGIPLSLAQPTPTQYLVAYPIILALLTLMQVYARRGVFRGA